MKSPLEGTKKFADEEQGGSLFVTVTCSERGGESNEIWCRPRTAAPTPTLTANSILGLTFTCLTLLCININIYSVLDYYLKVDEHNFCLILEARWLKLVNLYLRIKVHKYRIWNLHIQLHVVPFRLSKIVENIFSTTDNFSFI
jgi:hypothetical protein